MVNENYAPSETEEEILELLQEGRSQGEPWGYATPGYIRQELGVEEGTDSFHLRQLQNAGWIKKVSRGFYKFVEDPR